MRDDILNGRQFAALHDGAMLAALPFERNTSQALLFRVGDEPVVQVFAEEDIAFDERAARLWQSLSTRFPTVTARRLLATPAFSPDDE